MKLLGDVEMGCCGGGYNQNPKNEDMEHKEEYISGTSALIYFVVGMLILGLVATYFIK